MMLGYMLDWRRAAACAVRARGYLVTCVMIQAFWTYYRPLCYTALLRGSVYLRKDNGYFYDIISHMAAAAAAVLVAA